MTLIASFQSSGAFSVPGPGAGLGRLVVGSGSRARGQIFTLYPYERIDAPPLSLCRPLRLPPPEVREHAARQYDRFYESGASGSGACELEWAANRRTIDRVNPGYEG